VMEDAPSSVDDLLVWVRDLMDGRLAHSSHVELELNAEPMWSAMVARARTAPDQTALRASRSILVRSFQPSLRDLSSPLHGGTSVRRSSSS
jgi:hypothetical protein